MSIRPSVRLSVRHTPVLCLNGYIYFTPNQTPDPDAAHCWQWRQPLQENVIQWTSCTEQLLPDVTNHQYHLRQRRHNHCSTVKTDDRNFVTRQLFKDLYWHYMYTFIFTSVAFCQLFFFTVLMNEWMNECSTGNKKHDWPASRWLAVRCSTGSVALPIVGDCWVASVRVFIATQLELNSTSSWVASL